MSEIVNGATPGGYTGPCRHCRRLLVECPDDHCPDCIYVEGVSEPDICDCDARAEMRRNVAALVRILVEPV